MEQTSPSEEQTVFDTSSLVFLDLLGYVPLLRHLYGVVLPEAVSEELSARPGAPGGVVVSLDWVANRVPDAESVRQVRREPPTVGKGEAEVIALGPELSYLVVLDDRKARPRARRAGLEITGTLEFCSGCTVSASRRGTSKRTCGSSKRRA